MRINTLVWFIDNTDLEIKKGRIRQWTVGNKVKIVTADESIVVSRDFVREFRHRHELNGIIRDLRISRKAEEAEALDGVEPTESLDIDVETKSQRIVRLDENKLKTVIAAGLKALVPALADINDVKLIFPQGFSLDNEESVLVECFEENQE